MSNVDSCVVIQLSVLVILSVSITSLAEICQQDGPCLCKFDNGGEIDLGKIGLQNGSALIENYASSDGYEYSFNPCYPFSQGPGACQLIAGCQQYIANDSVYYVIGDASNPSLQYVNNTLYGQYSHTSELGITRKSIVKYICDEKAETPTVDVLGETSTAVYEFTITSKYACPFVGPTPTPTPTSPQIPWCTTDYINFIKRCHYGYDGHPEPVKLVIIQDWNGICKFPENIDIALHLYNPQSTCQGVNNRCKPSQPFSVNEEVCKEP
ncbi:hypothetical protein ACF0H5_018532 [Mactra antiquata]